MQDAADCHHQSADTLLPQADPVFDHTTALHTAVDMLDPETAVVQGLVGPVLRQRQLLAAWLFGWMKLSRCRQGAVVVHGKRRAVRSSPSRRHAAIGAWNAASKGGTRT